MEYALVIDGAIQETRWLEDRPENIPHKKVEWFPIATEEGEGPSTLDRAGDRVVRYIPRAAPQPKKVSTYRIVRRIEEAGKLVQADVLISQHPNLKFRFLTIGDVPCDDPDAAAMVKALGLDPDIILAPEA